MQDTLRGCILHIYPHRVYVWVVHIAALQMGIPVEEISKLSSKSSKVSRPDTMGQSRGKARMTELASQGLAPTPTMSVPHMPLTEARKQTFLARLAETGNISQAASLTDGGIGSVRSYRRLAVNDPAFARLMADAIEGFAARVNEAVIREGLEGQMVPLVSAGEIMRDPESKQPIYVRKVSEKILLQLARSTNAAMRDHKVVTNVDGTPAHDAVNDPRIILSVSDLQRLTLADQAKLIEIAKRIYANRADEFAGPSLKDITPGHDIEDVDYEESTPSEENPYDL